MPITQNTYPLLSRERLTEDVFSYWIDCPELAGAARPGQFVHVRVPGFALRRPISVCEAENGALRLVFQVRGAGTERFAELRPGDPVDLMGPLGNGFSPGDPDARAVLVGGGIGTPPMLALARHYRAAEVFLGFRSAESALLLGDFARAGARVTLATDDGSAGLHGLITGPLAERLGRDRPDVLYACGPAGLLKAVQALARACGVRAYLSLEERMACGVGACFGCSVPVRTEAGEVYRRVCKDGPVFRAEEVVFA